MWRCSVSEHIQDPWFEQWWLAMPEGKLELIDGKLIISTLAGSRRVLWELLHDYGPDLLLPMAETVLWWTALRAAYAPQPQPQTLADWRAWAVTCPPTPEAAPAGPQGSNKHHQLYDILRWGLYHFGQMSRLGRQMGRDFVIHLGADGPTPDVVFIDRTRLAYLYDRYLDGPPAIAIEIVQEGSAEQDRLLKRQLYEQAGVPEYWLVEPEQLTITFFRLQANGRYDPHVIAAHDVQRMVTSKEDMIYHSEAVPGLSLSLMDLWTMEEHDWQDTWRPFRRIAAHPEPLPPSRSRHEGIQWDTVPFGPRVALDPVAIRFEEYVSWCGRAKFEYYGGGLKIDGMEGTRRVAGMLLMTFGLREVVTLAHPREWVAFLDPEPHRAAVAQHTARLMPQAQYEAHTYHQDRRYYRGTIAQLPDLSGYGDTLEECQHDLTKAVQGWVLLRLARQEPIPDVA
jgi:Uma2 family endonuclease